MKPIRTIEKLAYGEGTPDELADMMEAELAELRSRVTALEEAAPEPDMPTDVLTRTFRVPTFENLSMSSEDCPGGECGTSPVWGNTCAYPHHYCWQRDPDCWLVEWGNFEYEFPDVESARVFLGMLICPEVVFGL